MIDKLSPIRKQALKYLARREYYQAELQQKLVAKGHAEQHVNTVLDDLTREGVLSDYRFLEAYIHARQSKFYGPSRISAELEQKNFSAQLISEILLAHPADWEENARTCCRKKFGGPPANEQEYKRQQDFLCRRGYSDTVIRTVLK